MFNGPKECSTVQQLNILGGSVDDTRVHLKRSILPSEPQSGSKIDIPIPSIFHALLKGCASNGEASNPKSKDHLTQCSDKCNEVARTPFLLSRCHKYFNQFCEDLQHK